MIPCVCFAVLLFLKNIYPFGSISNCKNDLQIQYYDFFCYLKNIFSGEAGVTYTFTKSLGSSPVALIGYYLLSPFNLLLVFFEKSQIQLFVYVITMIKLGLCGAFTCVYLSKRFPALPAFYNLAFAAAFAFTQYTLGQSANINWLDGVYMLPLMMLGIYRYVRQSKYSLFCISITFSIIFCWYTGYMNCIFAVLYFLCEYFLNEKPVTAKHTVQKTAKFLLLELLGVFMSLAVFLPVLLSQASGRSFDECVLHFGTNGSVLDILNGLLIGSPFPSRDITFFCTVFVLLSFFSFWFTSGKHNTDKCVLGCFFAVMLSLLFFTPLENIMHGFKIVAGFAYRHTYLVIMSAVFIGAFGLNAIQAQRSENTKSNKAVLFGAITFAGCLLLSYAIKAVNHTFTLSKSLDTAFTGLQIFVIALYTAAPYAYSRSNRPSLRRLNFKKASIALAVAGIFALELMLNAYILFDFYRHSAEENANYTISQQEAVDALKKYDNSFYRIENTYNRGKHTSDNEFENQFYANESLAYGYSTIQSYTSCYESSTAQILVNSGYCTQEFPSLYLNPILPMDSLLGVKYLISDQSYAGYQEISVDGASNVYLNPYALPLAFSVADTAVNETVFENSFEYINSLYSNILGETVDILKEVTPDTAKQEGGNIVCSFEDIDTGFCDSDIFYLAIANPEIESTILLDGNKIAEYNKGDWGMYSNIAYLGNLNTANKITVSDSGLSVNEIDLVFYCLDLSEFEEAVAKLKENVPEINTIKDSGYVKATYTSDSEGFVLFTIPKQEQWEIRVNGNTIEEIPSESPFILVPVSEGENVIVLTYRVKGLVPGIVLSAVSVGIFIIVTKSKKRKKT